MRIKIHPPIIFLLALISNVLIIRFFDQFNYPRLGTEFMSYLIMGTGFILVASALVSFRRVGTTVDPIEPENANQLVTTGPYRFSRNPMYLSMVLLLVGLAFKNLNGLTLFPILAFMWFITQNQIKPEEKALREKFGEQYDKYCQRTRRWA